MYETANNCGISWNISHPSINYFPSIVASFRGVYGIFTSHFPHPGPLSSLSYQLPLPPRSLPVLWRCIKRERKFEVLKPSKGRREVKIDFVISIKRSKETDGYLLCLCNMKQRHQHLVSLQRSRQIFLRINFILAYYKNLPVRHFFAQNLWCWYR